MKKTTIKIDGMMCGMCEAHVKDVIRRNFKAKKISVSRFKNAATIISENAFDERQIKTVIENTGYRIISISVTDYEKKGLFSFFKRK